MKTIAIRKSQKAYLPEIEIYKRYFSEYRFIDFYDEKDLCGESVDLLWMFMGMDRRKHDIPCIHEYVTLSLPPMVGFKDWLKKRLNAKPDLRVFLHEDIEKKLNFQDGVPCCYRDMGVDGLFFAEKPVKKQYDFVYVGSMAKDRHLENFLIWMKRHSEATMLLVGEPPQEIYQEYGSCKNIVFTGRVTYDEVPAIAQQAEYAVNYIPDVFPFNIQTSTKLLEYAAMGMKIVTTSYSWVRNFADNRGMKFFYLDENCSNLNMDTLANFDFVTTDIRDLEWKNILDKSGLRQAIAKVI